MHNKVTWISHRGFGSVENTKQAFDHAVEKGFKVLETDLRVTKDGHLLLCHDVSFLRVGGSSTPVAQLTRDEIQRVSLDQGCSPMFFDEFIETYAGLSWTLDIKPEAGMDTLQALKKWSDLHHAGEWLQTQAQFLFWDKKQQEQCLQFFPQARCYARKYACWSAAARTKAKCLWLGGVQQGVTYSAPVYMGRWQVITKDFVDEIHRYGAKVLAFLPETDHEVECALTAGVDEILTNGEIVDFEN